MRLSEFLIEGYNAGLSHTIHEDDNWLVVIPLEEASCFYGKNTDWCVDDDLIIKAMRKDPRVFLKITKPSERIKNEYKRLTK